MRTPNAPPGATILPFRRRAPEEAPPRRDPRQRRQERVKAQSDREGADLLARLGPLEDLTAQISALEGQGTTEGAEAAAVVYIMRAIVRNITGDVEGSIADTERAVALGPDQVNVLYTAATLLRREGRPGAVALLDRIAALTPTDPEAYQTRGEALADEGDHERALASFRRALTLDPASKDAHAEMAASLRALGRLDEAIDACGTALRFDPNDADLRRVRACYHADKGDHEAAVRDLDRAIKLRPTEAYWVSERADAHAFAGRPAEAIADYTRAMQLEPDEAQFPAARATIHLQAGAFDAAIRDFDAAIRLKPSTAHHYWGRAIVHLGRRDSFAALADYERAIDRAPNELRCRVEYVRCLARVGLTDEALAVIRDGFRHTPGSVDLLLERARIHEDNHDYKAAGVALNAAVMAAQRSAEPFLARAKFFARHEDFVETVAEARRAGLLADTGELHASEVDLRTAASLGSEEALERLARRASDRWQ